MNQATFHKTIGKFVFLASFLVLLAVPSQVLGAEGITGDWEITMDFDGWQAFAKLSISKKADGTLAGKWGESELSDIKFDAPKLTFVRTVKMQDQEFEMTYEGTLKDGKLTGQISSDRGEFSANGARIKPRPAILGEWGVKLMFQEREFEAKLSISQKPDGTLAGDWISQWGEHVVSDVKFQDGKLTFARKSKFGDRELESTYEGTLKGHMLTGKIKSEMGEMVANGQRAGAALVGKWELRTTSDRGTFTNTLTVYGDMTGRYEFFADMESPVKIKDLKLEGSSAAFNMDMGSADQPFQMEFKGTLDGATLNGQFTSSRGDTTVTGKKMDDASALVGTWEFTRETPRGTRTNTLKIKEDMTGTYTVRDNEIDITDLGVEGDRLTFKVTMRFGEREFPMEFKGRLDGTALKGEFITSRGSREATGKKVD